MKPTGKIVIFGAGKIGRSFIGQLFSRGGFEVVFVDVFAPVIEALNRRGNYNVIIKSEKEQILNVSNVRGVLSTDEDKVIDEIAGASIMAVSVGSNVMSKIAPIVAKGLIRRFSISKDSPLDIILAENLLDAAPFFHEKLIPYLPVDYPFGKLVGLIETSFGKMVPIMQKKDIQKDILQIFAEPYNTLILNKKAFKNPIPDIKGLAPKENMKALVDRKLFIHNLGHSAAAYIGFLYNPRFIYLYDALAVSEVHDHVIGAMLQSADILMKKYPGEFTSDDLKEHINDLLLRFQNKALGDTLFRVGCDLMRKLGSEDRLAGAIKTALDFNLSYDKILFALVCGCHFKARDEDGNMLIEDIEFIRHYENGIKSILTKICGFDEISNKQLFHEAEIIDEQLINLKKKSDFRVGK